MALTLKHIPEQTYLIGPGAGWRLYQATPAASDYATGGYLITPAQVDLTRIVGAIITSQKYVSAGTTVWQTSLPAAAYAATPTEGSNTGIYLTAWQSGIENVAAANLTEVAAATDLSGFPVWLLFLGY